LADKRVSEIDFEAMVEKKARAALLVFSAAKKPRSF
jgi:hypothetical protein